MEINITDELFKMRDEGYRDFHARLMPTADKELIIGVRTPALRAFAEKIRKQPEAKQFIASLPHKYYEENNLHAFLLEKIKDFDTAVYETERFLPYIDNWATCDCFMPRVFGKNKDALARRVYKWLASDKEYTVRFAVKVFMKLYLDDDFKEEYMEAVSHIRSEEYYINMMTAWYFAEALVKKYEYAVKYIEEKRLEKWVHNKAIQKARESRRIPDDIKEYLNGLKINV